MIKWLYDRYVLTALVAACYMIMAGYGTYQIFIDVSAITDAAAGAYLTLMGLPAAAVALIKWRIEKDNP